MSERITEVDVAYQERNRLVALLARLYPSGLKRTDIPGWMPEWHGCVYIDLPTGQAWPDLGGTTESFTMVRRKEPLKGETIGSFKLSASDADLASVDWYRQGNYWVRQPHLSPPTGYLHQAVARRLWRSIPEGWEIDHIDRDGSNCSRSNLRLATPQANKLNRGTTRGHIRLRPSGRWQAVFGGDAKAIGIFDTPDEARAACRSLIMELLEIAHRNGDFIYPPLQCSWHYHDRDSALFDGLPPYKGEWDGHTTEEKYRRIALLSRERVKITSAETVIKRIAGVAHGIGFQAGVSATEVAGQIVSILAANPQHIDRFLTEGQEIFIDGTVSLDVVNGCLTYDAMNGDLLSPGELHKRRGGTVQ